MRMGALVEEYRNKGFVVIEDVLNQQEVAELQRVTHEVIAAAASVSAHTEVYDLEPDHTPANPRVRRVKSPHLVHPAYDRVRKHPAILAILRALLGSAVRYESGKLNVKAAGGGAPVEWHQDWAFLPYTNDDCLALAIMIDDCDEENGALLCVPGSHRGPILDHHVGGRFCGAINAATSPYDYSTAVALTGRAGSITVHHTRTIHGSAPNRSARPRRLLLNQYVAADAWPLLYQSSIREFDENLLCGQGTLTPRMEAVPIRLPLPPADNQGSIYENQKTLPQSYFHGALEDAGT